MSTESTPPLPEKRPPKALITFKVTTRLSTLVRWLLAVGLGTWGGWLLYQQATPFPTEPPSIFSLVLIALGFAAFFFFPETDLEG